MITGLVDISAQCQAHGRITGITMVRADDATLPQRWLSGYVSGNVTGVTGYTLTPTQGSARLSVSESITPSGKSYATELVANVSLGQQEVDEMIGSFAQPGCQVHLFVTDQSGIVRMLEHASIRAIFNIGPGLGNRQQYTIRFTSTNDRPPGIYQGTIP